MRDERGEPPPAMTRERYFILSILGGEQGDQSSMVKHLTKRSQ